MALSVISSALEALVADSAVKDRYIALLEEKLSAAEHRILMLEAEKAILDPGMPPRPSSPDIWLEEAAASGSRPQGRRRGASGHANAPVSVAAPAIASVSESRSSASASPSGSTHRSSSISFSSTPTIFCPANKKPPTTNSVLSKPAIKPYKLSPPPLAVPVSAAFLGGPAPLPSPPDSVCRFSPFKGVRRSSLDLDKSPLCGSASPSSVRADNGLPSCTSTYTLEELHRSGILRQRLGRVGLA